MIMDWGDLADLALDRLDGANTVTQAVGDTAIPGEAPVWATSARARQEWTNGTLVLTTHRLVHVKEGRPPAAMPLAGITDVGVTRSRLSGTVLKVTFLSGAHSWENVTDIETFVGKLREAVADAANPRHALEETTVPGQQGDGPSMLDELERLAVLHRDGALTDEEFTRAKRRLIGD
jgi:hypothetical protein